MALVKERRQLNLRLPLAELSERRPRFPLPLPPSSSSTTTASSTTTTTITAADLEKIQVLGHGNGGTVYKVRNKRSSALYALKVVQSDSDPEIRRQIFREISILRRTDSPYVVKFQGVFEKPGGEIAILMEYMDKGTLENLIKSGAEFTEEMIAKIALQVVQGLEYLHSHKIIHRDLKPSNLLVNEEMQVKIADFGVSKIMCRTLDPCNSYVGTCAYMSPERFDPDTYGNDGTYNGYASDIWSLGLTLLELYMGHFPYLPAGQRPDWATLMCAICFGEPQACQELPPRNSGALLNVVCKRIQVKDVILHSYCHTLFCRMSSGPEFLRVMEQNFAMLGQILRAESWVLLYRIDFWSFWSCIFFLLSLIL